MDICFNAWRRLRRLKVKLKVSWREKNRVFGLAQCRTLGIQQRKAHKLLDWRQEPSVLSHPPGWRPLPSHSRPLSSSSLFILAAIVWRLTSLPSLISSTFSSSRLAFPFFSPLSLSLSLHPFLVLSQDALMSAHTCCHIPPVPSSARHDQIQLNSAAVGQARNKLDKPEYIKRAGRNQRGGWDGTPVNIAWTGDLHVPRILCSPNLDDTMTNGLILPGSSSPPLWGWCELDPSSNN